MENQPRKKKYIEEDIKATNLNLNTPRKKKSGRELSNNLWWHMVCLKIDCASNSKEG